MVVWFWARLRYLPVLAIVATEVTSHRSQWIDAHTGEEVKQGFLLYRVNTDRAGISISLTIQLAVIVDPRLANPGFTLLKNTVMRTKMAVNLVIRKLFLITCQAGPFSQIDCFHWCSFKMSLITLTFPVWRSPCTLIHVSSNIFIQDTLNGYPILSYPWLSIRLFF